jgi:hypothetical protein
MQETKKLSPVLATLIIVVLIGIVVTTVIIGTQTKETTVSDTTQNTEAKPDTTNEADASGVYTNGTYTERGTYRSPGGAESVNVTVTIENDIITAAEVKGSATAGESRQYQSEFISGYKKLVVGKDIDEVKLSRVAGSSLTSNGFNAALERIKADAKA